MFCRFWYFIYIAQHFIDEAIFLRIHCVHEVVSLEVAPDRDCHLVVVSVQPDGDVQLFPNAAEPDGLVAAGSRRVIPGTSQVAGVPTQEIIATPSEGEEYLLVVATTSAWQLPEGESIGNYLAFSKPVEREQLRFVVECGEQPALFQRFVSQQAASAGFVPAATGFSRTLAQKRRPLGVMPRRRQE